MDPTITAHEDKLATLPAKDAAQPASTPETEPSSTNVPTASISSQGGDCGCVASSSAQALLTRESPEIAHIYALGRIEARFPTPGVEKEFAQAVGRTDTSGQTDQKAFHTALVKRENRYLARKVCWVHTIQGLDSYILVPRDPADLDLLIEAIRPAPSPLDVDVVIGQRGSLAPPAICNGLVVPLVLIDQIYSFDSQSLIKSIPIPEDMKADDIAPAAEEVFQRIMQLSDNAGATDEHRALNYLAMRYSAIYTKAAEAYGREMSLTAVDVRNSRLSGPRKIQDVIFTYTNRTTDVEEKYFVRVDVTELFPFLVTKLSPYFDR